MTSSLDLFLIIMRNLNGGSSLSRIFTSSDEEKLTEAYQINHPSLNDEFKEQLKLKHASGQLVSGTVVCKEYPVWIKALSSFK